MNLTGFFVDWDGNTRRFESPGDGLTCQIASRNYPSVDVINADSYIIHEASFFPTLEALKAVGVTVNNVCF